MIGGEQILFFLFVHLIGWAELSFHCVDSKGRGSNNGLVDFAKEGVICDGKNEIFQCWKNTVTSFCDTYLEIVVWHCSHIKKYGQTFALN